MHRGRFILQAALALAAATTLGAQSLPLTDAALTGKYFGHHVVRMMSSGTTVIDQRTVSGVLQFDGNGAYSFAGTRKVGTGAAEALNTNGTYTVNPIGLVRLSNLQGAGPDLNARLSTIALVGSSTEATGGLFDLFVAIPAPTGIVLPTLFDGPYRAAGLEFESGAAPVSRATFFTISVGSLAISTPLVQGIASNAPGGLQQSTFPTSPLTFNSEGRGLAQIPSPGIGSLYFGNKTVYGSRDGNVLLLVPDAAGTHGLTVALRVLAPATNASLSGLYWSAGLRQNGARPGSFTGTVNSIGNGVALVSRRAHEIDGLTDFTGRADYQVATAGTGTILTQQLALGAGGSAFVSSGASVDDPDNFELNIGVKATDATPTIGPYLNPYGAVNTASFAPPANPVAPGQYVDLYGAGLASASTTATAPFPTLLGGVQVLVNERAAPLYIVSPTLIKILIPQATALGAGTVVAVVNGIRSNPIPIVVALSAPGIFSATQNGIGPGAILRANSTVMTAANPPRRGETIQVFLTGLGAVTPAVADGAVAPSSTLSFANTMVRAYIRGVEALVSFKGLAPGIVSLNQVNVTIPAAIQPGTWPLAIETSDGFTDQVDVIVGQ